MILVPYQIPTSSYATASSAGMLQTGTCMNARLEELHFEHIQENVKADSIWCG